MSEAWRNSYDAWKLSGPPEDDEPQPARPCKHCGNTDAPDTTCSRCGGHGMVTGGLGDPMTCPACGCSGIQWPPMCPNCSKFRSLEPA